MLRTLSLISLVLVSISAGAQVDSGIMHFGNNGLLVNANGTLFKGGDSMHVHEYPYMSGNHLLGFAGFWIGAKDASSNLYTSIATGDQESDEFWPGPIDTLTGLAKDPDDWNTIWIVTRKEVQDHITYWNKSGYQMPEAIKNWPGRHNDDNIKPHMAPYADANLNGTYDPEAGDYPLIKGDIAAYFVANDAFGEHTISGGLKLNVEIHGMSYAFNSGKDSNILFNEYFFVNRSEIDYDSVLIGVYNDVILGNPQDNFVGSQVDLHTVYAYNGDADDEGYYGNQMPVVSVTGLNARLYAAMSFGPDGSERKLPQVQSEYWNALNARWSDGQSLRYGEDGRNTLDQPTRWIYPGETNPLISGSWTDADAGNGAGKRNILAVYGPFSLAAGDFINLNTAVFWQTKFEISTFRNRISTLIKDHGTLLSTESVASERVKMWPNPATSGQKLYFDKNVTQVEIWDLNGRLIESCETNKNMAMQCSVSAQQGVYWVKAIYNHGFTWMKLVIQ